MSHDEQGLTCPKCGSQREANALDCPFCGIVYARFDPARQTSQAQHGSDQAGVWDQPQQLEDDYPWDEPEQQEPPSEWDAPLPEQAQGSAQAAHQAEPAPIPQTAHDRILERLEDLHIVILGALILIHLAGAAVFSTHFISADDDLARAIQQYRSTTGKPMPQRFEAAANLSFVGRTLVLLYEEREQIFVAVYTEGALAGTRDSAELRKDAHRLLRQLAAELEIRWEVKKRVAGWIRGEKVTVDQLGLVGQAQPELTGYFATTMTEAGRPACILIAGSSEPAYELAKEVFARE